MRRTVTIKIHHIGILAAALVALTGCANMPERSQRSTQAQQPLQRMNVAPIPASQDVLTHLLAGEFALSNNDLATAAREYAQAAAVDNDPEVSEQATHIALAGKLWEPARSSLQRWEILRPEASGVRQARAIVALHDGDETAAYENLLLLAQLSDGKGWREIAQALLSAQDQPQAGKLLERLTSPVLLGSKPETWITASQTAFRLQNKALAQALAEQAVHKFSTAETYSWNAQIKMDAGDRVGARTLFADALKRDAKNARLRVAYATLLGELGDNAQAGRVLAGAEQNDYTYAARAAYAARDADKAEVLPLYNEVKALAPPQSGLRLNLLGQLADLLGRKAEALEWYAKISDADEHWFEAQVRTAVLLDDSGKSAEALTLVHELQARAVDDDKQLGEAFLLETELHARHKQSGDTIATFDRGLLALPDDTRLLYGRAMANEDQGHVDSAIGDLRRVLALKPDDADAMNALGYTLADRTDLRVEALGLIEKALMLKPGEPAIMDSLGWVHYRMGRLDAAEKQLRMAYQKQPDAEIAAHLGEVLWVSGQKDEAKKVWDQGRKKDAKNKVLLDTIQRLAS